MGRGSRQQADALDIRAVLDPSLRPRAVAPVARGARVAREAREFRCPSCPASFASVSDCMQHQRVMHPGAASRFSVNA